jgi:hypothetical protein
VAQRLADAAEHLVAHQVAVLLVDLLEVVHVHQREREPVAVRSQRSISLVRASCMAAWLRQPVRPSVRAA